LSFLLTGWSWLLLTALLGLATFIGIVRGSPLPPGLRLLHVHGALVGGLLQMTFGLALAAIELASHETKPTKRLGLFIGLNLAVVGLAAGSWLHEPYLAIGAGLLLALLCIPMAQGMVTALRTCPGWTALSAFLMGIALTGLFGSLVLGGLLAGAWFPTWHGMLRLGHLHAGLVLFFTLGTIGTIQLALPPLLDRRPRRAGSEQIVFLLLPAGAAGLLTGFLLSSVHIQLVAGGCLLVTLALSGILVFRAWSQSGHPGSAAIDHLITAVFFLLTMTLIGMAVGINALWTPPVMPYGTLHLVAYTHQAFIGFLLQAIIGGLSYALPALLVAQRTTGQKKRTAYRNSLDGIMNRWRALQLSTLSFGTLGLVLVAVMTWTFPLSSPWIHTATWVSFGLLLSHLTLMTMKIAYVLGTHPAGERAAR
jgi:hypothetical protein